MSATGLHLAGPFFIQKISRLTLAIAMCAARQKMKCKPPFSYYGGKGSQKMQNIIQELKPRYKIYGEPFAGAASTLFHLENFNHTVEFLNDKNNLLGNFYRVVKDPKLFSALMAMIEGTLHNENDFRRAAKIYLNPKKYHRVERAWAVWAGFNMAHASTIHRGSGFACDRNRVSRGMNKEASKISTSKKNAELLAARLERVTITCIDAIRFIDKIDGPDTFFFIDPPYPGSDQGHFKKFGFGMPEFVNLLEKLSEIKGKFLLTSGLYPELEAARNLCRWGHHEVKIKNAISYNDGGETISKTVERVEAFTWNYNECEKIGGLFK